MTTIDAKTQEKLARENKAAQWTLQTAIDLARDGDAAELREAFRLAAQVLGGDAETRRLMDEFERVFDARFVEIFGEA